MQAIRSRHLKAALCCAATKDIRYYLHGVFVEIRNTEIRCVGCDGSTGAVLRDLSQDADRVSCDVIIPSETVKLALAGKSEALGLSCIDGHWKLGAINFTPVDGRFPDYRRIIHSKHSGYAAQSATDLVAQFAKVGKALGHRGNPIIRHNGDGGAQVQFYGDDSFVGVIMPLRAFTEKHPDTGLIQWGAERAA